MKINIIDRQNLRTQTLHIRVKPYGYEGILIYTQRKGEWKPGKMLNLYYGSKHFHSGNIVLLFLFVILWIVRYLSSDFEIVV
jgi:hypothetical protein